MGSEIRYFVIGGKAMFTMMRQGGLAGVEMLRSDQGTVVMVVISSPGLKGIEKTAGIDGAAKIIVFIDKNA